MDPHSQMLEICVFPEPINIYDLLLHFPSIKWASLHTDCHCLYNGVNTEAKTAQEQGK